MLTHDLNIQMTEGGVLCRRSFLRAGAGLAGVSALGYDVLRFQAAELRRQGRACILLFMNGGPSQFETFDPKPGTRTGGPTRAISTAVPGIRIAEHWPRVAKQLTDIAIVRSMTSGDGDHIAAQYRFRTGYDIRGGVKYPHFGSNVANELGDAEFDLPHFACIAGRANAGSGFLSNRVAPYFVTDPNKLPFNSQLPPGVDEPAVRRRLNLLDKLERDYAEAGAERLVKDHRVLNHSAARMVLSPRLKAFDIAKSQPPCATSMVATPLARAACSARRLVEAGVTFVEVITPDCDTHRDNFNGQARLAAVVDPAYTALLQDLKDRGMLEKTLVIWVGEFGRTPRINANAGRDHYPRVSSVALAGAGIRGGQVIGSTDNDGVEVATRPVTVPDLFCTFCRALQINPRKANLSDGRRIRIVEDGEAVNELFN